MPLFIIDTVYTSSKRSTDTVTNIFEDNILIQLSEVLFSETVGYGKKGKHS